MIVRSFATSCFLLGLWFGFGAYAAEVQGEPIKIPAIMPLSGAVAIIGQDAKKGIEIAVQEINKNGGIGGRPLQETVDTQSNPEIVRREMERLTKLENAPFIIGCESSGGMAAAAQFADQAGVPLLNALAAADLFNRGYKWYFSQQITNEDFAEAAVSFIKAISGGETATGIRVAMANEDSQNGAGNADRIAKIYAKEGRTLVGHVSYNRAERNLLPFMKKIEESKPDILIWSSYAGDVIAGLSALQQLEFYPYVVGIGGGLGDPRLPELVDPSLLTKLHASNIDYFNPDLKRATDFTQAFKRVYGIEPSSYAASCYPAVFTMKAAYEMALKRTAVPGRADLRDALRELDLPGSQTITSAKFVRFDATGRNVGARALASQWKENGKKKLPVWPDELALTAPDLLKTGKPAQ
jgi:branched-chain amino acid transport system substrate-binding protein